jgi:hypothetical protein
MSRIAHDRMYALGETGHIAQVADSRSDAVSAPRSFIGYQPARFTGCTKRNNPTDSGSVAELSASIAHQLSQPLTSMLANAQAAKRWLVAGRQNLMEAIASGKAIEGEQYVVIDRREQSTHTPLFQRH